jgi:hypothetical protein
VDVPLGVVELVLIVIVEESVPVSDAGLKLALEPSGKPFTLNTIVGSVVEVVLTVWLVLPPRTTV